MNELSNFAIWSQVNVSTFLEDDRANPARKAASEAIEAVVRQPIVRSKKSFSVLEIGPGNGIDYQDHFSKLEASKLISYEAYEPSPKLRAEFQRRCPQAKVRNATFAQLKPKSWSCIYVKAVFEHQPEIVAPLKAVLDAAVKLVVINWYLPPDDELAKIELNEAEQVYYNIYPKSLVSQIIAEAGWTLREHKPEGSLNTLYILTR